MVNAQSLNQSPYTRYGLGEVVKPMSTSYLGMGSASISLAGHKHINFANPASYGFVAKYSPIFDAGFMGKTSNLETSESSFNGTTVALRNFSLLMPIAKNTGLVFGLMPYSTTGYDITNKGEINGDSVTYNNKGFGSVNRLLFGLGRQIINKGDSVKFSVGANASFLFGTLEKDRTVVFQAPNYYNTKLVDKSIVRGLLFDVGLHYYEKINKNFSYQLGATANLGRAVTGYKDIFAYSYLSSDDQIFENPKDTLIDIVDNKGSFNIPTGVGFGTSVIYKEKFTFSAQYEFQNWQDYSENFDSTSITPSEMRQSHRFSYGIEYDAFSSTNLKDVNVFKISTYRLGFHHGNTPYFISDTHLKQYGISFGISIPLISSGSYSSLSLGFELGKIGTTENGLIADNYFNFNIGFSLLPNMKFDRWFRKRLYD